MFAPCVPVYLFLIPSFDPRKGTPWRARVAEIDWLGALLFCGGFVSIVMAITFGGTVYAWVSLTCTNYTHRKDRGVVC